MYEVRGQRWRLATVGDGPRRDACQKVKADADVIPTRRSEAEIRAAQGKGPQHLLQALGAVLSHQRLVFLARALQSNQGGNLMWLWRSVIFQYGARNVTVDPRIMPMEDLIYFICVALTREPASFSNLDIFSCPFGELVVCLGREWTTSVPEAGAARSHRYGQDSVGWNAAANDPGWLDNAADSNWAGDGTRRDACQKVKVDADVRWRQSEEWASTGSDRSADGPAEGSSCVGVWRA